MKQAQLTLFLGTIFSLFVSCEKYLPGNEPATKGEWVFTTRFSIGTSFLDTIWPGDKVDGINQAQLRISGLNSSRSENAIQLYLNGSLVAIKEFDNIDTGFDLSYPGNPDNGGAVRLFTNEEEFYYSRPNDIQGYDGIIATPEFPFLSNKYTNIMDTVTINYFRSVK